MSNHYHVVLHVDRQKAQSWSDAEVVEHWHNLFHRKAPASPYVLGKRNAQGSKTVSSIWECEKILMSLEEFGTICRP